MTTPSSCSQHPSPPSCTPKLHLAQPYESHLAEEAAQVGKMAGYELLPWQRSRLEDWSAIGSDGKWVHKRIGDSVPRQSGKSVDGIIWATFTASAMGYKVLWTDHNYSTTCEMLRRFQEIFGKRPRDPDAKYKRFNKLVKRTNNKTAQEFIELKNGGVIGFSTRTNSAALGFSYDIVIFDEAQELTDAQAQAILPTTSSCASQNPQVIYLGTPTRAGSLADKFQDLRKEAWDRKADDLTWCEYGIDDYAKAEDEAYWYEANPSLGLITTVDAIKIGRGGLSDLAFAQEYLGYWLPKEANTIISPAQWQACLIGEKAIPRGREAYGVKFSPDGELVALAVAVHPPEGPEYVELLELQPRSRGIGWLAEWLADHAHQGCCVAIDGLSGTGDLCDRLEHLKAPRGYVVRAKSSEVITAATMLEGAITSKAVTHIESPALDASVLTSTRRTIGQNGGWGWGGDSCAVEAASLALWAVRTTKRNPARKQVLW